VKRFTIVFIAAILSVGILIAPAILEAGGGPVGSGWAGGGHSGGHGGYGGSGGYYGGGPVGSGWAGGGHSGGYYGGHYGGPVGGHWGGYYGGHYGGYYGGHGHYYGGGYYPYWGYYPFAWGAWIGGRPYGGWPYASYAGWPYLGWPYYPSGVAEVPPAYSEPAPHQPDYWYYCQDPQGYYPYVKSCPGGWIPVVPNVTPPNQ
jgi:hypothetical protein